MSDTSSSWKSRFLAAGIHLTISLVVAALAAWLVFALWYPYPYREISGGRELFFIVVAVDVVMGPLLTLTVFNRRKPVSELRRDLSLVALLQVAALAYGLWTVAIARPVHLVFEIDRFRVVHAVDIAEEELKLTPPGLQAMPWTGPTLLSLRAFKNEKENYEATMAALQGVSLGARPALWQNYASGKSQLIKVAKPLSDLKNRFPAQAPAIDAALGSSSARTSVGYIPLVGRDKFWTVFVSLTTAEVLGFVPIDPY
jgi:hypothetical protein